MNGHTIAFSYNRQVIIFTWFEAEWFETFCVQEMDRASDSEQHVLVRLLVSAQQRQLTYVDTAANTQHVQSTLDISNSDISNSAKLEASF